MTVMTIAKTTPTTQPLTQFSIQTSGTLASVQRDGGWYLIDTSPGAKAPVLRLAGDTDDVELEPHICRSID
ncbi:hypothetical protein OG762_25640 [Streptomyces sp. NBC_01136]|uniref:hypothetical protein n=1 Tax=unclassified Streptomyces TaxID=2593676 RepID=UPI00325530D6|nr:hypothetical protein OG762_25640 [Streptomyces sp. NBC_01136]